MIRDFLLSLVSGLVAIFLFDWWKTRQSRLKQSEPIQPTEQVSPPPALKARPPEMWSRENRLKELSLQKETVEETPVHEVSVEVVSVEEVPVQEVPVQAASSQKKSNLPYYPSPAMSTLKVLVSLIIGFVFSALVSVIAGRIAGVEFENSPYGYGTPTMIVAMIIGTIGGWFLLSNSRPWEVSSRKIPVREVSNQTVSNQIRPGKDNPPSTTLAGRAFLALSGGIILTGVMMAIAGVEVEDPTYGSGTPPMIISMVIGGIAGWFIFPKFLK